jgi:lipid A 3-O-deacylase
MISCLFLFFYINRSLHIDFRSFFLKQRLLLLSFLLCAFSPFFSLKAEEDKTAKLLYMGAGVYDIIHNPKNLQLQLEYRSFIKSFHYARPLIGLFGTDKATFYFYSGMALDIFLGKKFVITPSFAPGLYFKGFGKNLWFPLEFRSSMEAAFVLPNKGRIGAQFFHISNASLGSKNPGAESLIFFYALPLY